MRRPVRRYLPIGESNCGLPTSDWRVHRTPGISTVLCRRSFPAAPGSVSSIRPPRLPNARRRTFVAIHANICCWLSNDPDMGSRNRMIAARKPSPAISSCTTPFGPIGSLFDGPFEQMVFRLPKSMLERRVPGLCNLTARRFDGTKGPGALVADSFACCRSTRKNLEQPSRRILSSLEANSSRRPCSFWDGAPTLK